MEALFKAMANSSGKSIIAGGDSVAAACSLGIASRIDHLLSGGGATLAYISGKELPGLRALKDRTKT
jgi:phosphoglycerate kinase